MIVGCITILLFLMSIFSKKNKVLYIVLFIWMWILMAFTTGIADEQEVYMLPQNYGREIVKFYTMQSFCYSEKPGVRFINTRP